MVKESWVEGLRSWRSLWTGSRPGSGLLRCSFPSSYAINVRLLNGCACSLQATEKKSMKKLPIIVGAILLAATAIGGVLFPAYILTIALGVVLIVYGLRRKKPA